MTFASHCAGGTEVILKERLKVFSDGNVRRINLILRSGPHTGNKRTVLQIWVCEKCKNECSLMPQLIWMRCHSNFN